MTAVETFLCAHQAAEKAGQQLALMDTGGWGPEDETADRLHSEARAAWQPLARMQAAGIELPRDVVLAARSYPYVNHAAAPMTPPWEQTIGLTDWSKGR